MSGTGLILIEQGFRISFLLSRLEDTGTFDVPITETGSSISKIVVQISFSAELFLLFFTDGSLQFSFVFQLFSRGLFIP